MSGMDEKITRRDFLDATLLATGAALAAGTTPRELLAKANEGNPFDGYSGVGDYVGANGNTRAVMDAGHDLRDRAAKGVKMPAVTPSETVDCVIVGGGISGLAAALLFQRQAKRGRAQTCLVLENHSIFGGLARQNEFEVDGHRLVGSQASAMFFPPLPGQFLAEFYPSIGIDHDQFEYQQWTGTRPEMKTVGRTFYFDGGETSAFYFGPKFSAGANGRLLVDPMGKRLEGAPIPADARRELLAMHDTHGVAERERPKEHGDAASRKLDSLTLEDHVMQAYGISRETVRTYLSPVTGGGSGVGADVLCAYADYAADVLLPWQYAKGSQMFPGGNTGVARHIVKSLIPDAIDGPPSMEGVARGRVKFAALDRTGQPSRIRTGCTVLSVSREGNVTYIRGGKLHAVRANSVIMAGGSWTSKHIISDLPDSHRQAYARFYRAPCLVANVAVRNWRFLYDAGIHEVRWFEGIGNFTAVRRMATFGPSGPTISPDSPVVLTLKILFSYPGETLEQQVTRGRMELLNTPFRDYEQRIREQLDAMFGRIGFSSTRDIAGIILNRWGHAYLAAQPGFFFGTKDWPAPGEVLRTQPVGRIAFANSDVTGIMDHRASILEAQRAVGQVLGSG
jgi:spermidine dehydrogenase